MRFRQREGEKTVHYDEGYDNRNYTVTADPFLYSAGSGQLISTTYNAVDSIIVGRWAGENALAAVGTANPVMSIVILGITGICIGASVLDE